MTHQARQLIQECLETQSTYLDLGNCGITDLNELPELFTCTHLETLILSNELDTRLLGKLVMNKSLNGSPNMLSSVPPEIES